MRICLLFSAFANALFAVAAPIEIVTPAANAVVPTLTDAQKTFLALSREERREKFADPRYRREMVRRTEKVDGKERASYWPKVTLISWKGDAERTYEVKVTSDKDGSVVFNESVKGLSVNVDNLEIACPYKVTVVSGEDSGAVSFRTEDVYPRLVRFPGVPNVRDLGGRMGLDGKRIRQGRIFRSAGLNDNATTTYYSKEELEKLGNAEAADAKNKGKRVAKDHKPGRIRLDDAGRAYVLGRFGIRTDIDLRSSAECYGMKGSPLGEKVQWLNYSSTAYGGMVKDHGRAPFKKVFKVFLDEANYPIDFHCIAGQDRTGSVAFILGALLGASEDSLYVDWEATGFCNRSVDFNHKKYFDQLPDSFRKTYPAETLRESAEKYILSLGFTEADIAKFRSLMLE